MASTSEQPINLSSLKQAIEEKNTEDVLTELEFISTKKNALIDDLAPFYTLLTQENAEVLTNTSKAIAELAKTLANRNKLSDSELIVQILHLLSIESTLPCQIQVCRALGNLCYESDAVRSILFENGALEKIIDILNNNLKMYPDSLTQPNTAENGNQSDTKSTDEKLIANCKNLRKVACGLLFNFLVSNDDIQKKALELNTLTTVEKILNIESRNVERSEECVTHLLLILTLLLDNGGEVWITEDISQSLIDILEISVNPDVSELCLEILHGQAENDEIKTFLAKHGLCELMYNLLEKHKELVNDEDSRALMKMVCDLIVLVLTGDDSMALLYSNGKGQVYKNMVSWLQSEDEDLKTTGILAVGNFARKDGNCIQMVQNGIAKKLLDILAQNNTSEGDLKLQHAVLSALRNLAIPSQNKSTVLNEGLVDVITPMLSLDQMPVIFKLLGTLRMVIDGQEETAVLFSSQKYFVERIVHWCYSTDHLGVKGESSRLLAWLIKNSHSSDCCANILSVPDSVKCLIDMIPSQHSVMQNEALLSLNLLVLTHFKENDSNIQTPNQSELESAHNISEECNVPKLEMTLIDANLGPNIATLLDKYNKSLEKEVVENLLVLLEQIIHYQHLCAHLREKRISDELKKLLSNPALSHLYDRIENLTLQIDSG